MINLIVAMDKNQVIGNRGELPWYLPADLQHFKQVTMGHPIIMGRKTYVSIGKPLQGRKNIILTRDMNFKPEGCCIYHDIRFALASALMEDEEVFVIGGKHVFLQAYPYAERMYVTHIDHEFEGDLAWTEIDWNEWRVISEKQGVLDEKNIYPHRFVVYERVKKPCHLT